MTDPGLASHDRPRPGPPMTDPGLAEQVAYYRRRAPEYDATSYGDVAAAQKRISRLVAGMRPAGRVLEIACGTGMWTAALASHADSARSPTSSTRTRPSNAA
jgi:demethylmenaquinone methyltransferase/2-methoxy-6-polyprenyl-1,4-benzoquinol methylase